MTITEEMLFQAAPEAARLYLDTLPDREASAHAFSPAFEAEMRPLLHRRRRSGRRLLALAAIVAALAVGFGAGLTVGAGQESDCQIYWSQSETAFSYMVQTEHDTNNPFQQPTLDYVPAGYYLKQESGNQTTLYAASYHNEEENKSFQITQERPDKYSQLLMGSYQGTEVEIGGVDGLVIENLKSGSCTLLWADGPYVLKIAAGNLSAEELIKIAEGVHW